MASVKQHWGSLGIALLLVAVAGCQASPTPRSRLGGLPFPGVATLYTTADPTEMGRHYSGLCDCDQHEPMLKALADETGRGLIYTRRAGFIDIAHLRNAADWTAYVHRHVRRAIEKQQPALAIKGVDHSRWHVQFDFPATWPERVAREGNAITDELSLRIAQQIAYQMVTWHEIITGFGYASTGIVPENRSAFTYDDIVAHALGVQLAADAIRAPGCFDRNVTQLLDQRLAEVDAVSPALTRAAVDMVRDQWWQPEVCLRYQFDVGLTSSSVTPWLVAGMSYDSACQGPPIHLANLRDVRGQSFEGICRVTIEPRVLQAGPMGKVLGQSAKRISVPEQFGPLIEHLRAMAKTNYGQECDQPPTPESH